MKRRSDRERSIEERNMERKKEEMESKGDNWMEGIGKD